VKLIRVTKGNFTFQLGKREKLLLFQVLRLYPRIPPATFRLSKSGKLPDADANQRLLEESLAEQRTQNRKTLQVFLTDPRRFVDTESGTRLSLSPSELEWVLQILNDVRVGSWVILGSPEQGMEFKLLNDKTAADFWAMEMAGQFQMRFLEAIEKREV
jgi:hypothetical protein